MNDAQRTDSPSPTPAAATMQRLIMGFRITQLVAVAARLGVADHLRHGPRTPDQLAGSIGADPRALHRVLRALASVGVFAETADGAFELTPLAELLRTDVPGSLHGVALLYGEEWLWQAYGRTLDSVRTGRPAFDGVHGEPLFRYLEHHPDAADRFQDGMSGLSAQEAGGILAAYDFSDIAMVVDVGGGHGALLAALLRAHPRLSGVVFDLPEVVRAGRRLLADAGVTDRATCVAGDFRAAVPSGGDVYLLKSVLHNWDDEAAVHILRTCRRAMPEHARLLVAERVIPPGNVAAEAKLFDINMLVVAGGQERTEREYRTLLAAAGFELSRIIPTASALSLLEGKPVHPGG
jgi:hypothetical protein